MNDIHETVTSAAARQGDPEVVRVLGLDRRAERTRWIARILTLLVVLAGAGYGVKRYLDVRAERGRPVFETAKVARTDIQVSITATGTVQGLKTVEVGAEVSGKVTQVNVDFNDKVKAGQVIAAIDPEQLEAALAEAKARVLDAEASIKQAEASVLEAQRNEKRAKIQAGQGLVSQSELEAAEVATVRASANLASARAGATLARATLEAAHSKLERTKILSPIDGIVLSRLVEPGQTVTAGFQTPVLFKIAEDLRRMSLHAFIDEADIGRAREGQLASFTVDAYPGKVFASELVALRNEPKTEQNVVSYEAVLKVDNGELLLRPGMTATATIVANRHADVLAVPNAALRFTPPPAEKPSAPIRVPGMSRRPLAQADEEAAQKRVWALEGGVPVSIAVKTGASDGVMTEIAGGKLAVGMEVLVDLVEEKK